VHVSESESFSNEVKKIMLHIPETKDELSRRTFKRCKANPPKGVNSDR
jgi:hypothetical protein